MIDVSCKIIFYILLNSTYQMTYTTHIVGLKDFYVLGRYHNACSWKCMLLKMFHLD